MGERIIIAYAYAVIALGLGGAMALAWRSIGHIL